MWITELARTNSTTPFVVLLSLYYLTLWAETACTDLVVASPFAGRTRPETMRTVGFLANFALLRVEMDWSAPTGELIRAVHRVVNEALTNQEFPYYLVRSTANAGGHRRIDDVVFQFLPPLPTLVRTDGIEIEIRSPRVAGRFALELTIVQHSNGFELLFQYAPDRVDPAFVRRLADRYRALLLDLT